MSGSSAAPRDPTSSRFAIGRKAEVKNAGNHEFEGPESARSGRRCDRISYPLPLKANLRGNSNVERILDMANY